MSPLQALWFTLLRSYGRFRIRPMRRSTCWNKLRIDTTDGTAAVEYRIKLDGGVVSPVLEYRFDEVGSEPMTWQRLTREELASLLKENMVVRYWMFHRLGADALRRACPESLSSDVGIVEGRGSDRRVSRSFKRWQAITEGG
jgi:hypothetical protein